MVDDEAAEAGERGSNCDALVPEKMNPKGGLVRGDSRAYRHSVDEALAAAGQQLWCHHKEDCLHRRWPRLAGRQELLQVVDLRLCLNVDVHNAGTRGGRQLPHVQLARQNKRHHPLQIRVVTSLWLQGLLTRTENAGTQQRVSSPSRT